MKTRIIAILAAVALMAAAGQSGFAQQQPSDAEPSEETDSEEGESEDGDSEEGETSEETDSEEGESEETDSEEGESEDGEPEEGETSEESDGEENSAEGADEDSEEGDEEESAEKGPGGKDLRDDYPGTEDAKKSRMDTDRIEGLDFEDDPEDGYDVRIRELETKVDDLKDRVFRSKSRIVLLKETVLSGNLSGSRAIVAHENDLGGAYKVSRAHYSLDGSRVFDEKSSEELEGRDKIQVYDGSISPGNHRVSILLELQGTGYGVFNYMDDYKFTLKDSCEFSAQEGRSSLVEVRLVDQGGRMASYEERPGIECVVSSSELTDEDRQVLEEDETDAPAEAEGRDEQASD